MAGPGIRINVTLLLLAAIPLVACQAGSKDWMDSPFTGQGTPPPNGTDVYLSPYLDRLIHINEQKYFFHVRHATDICRNLCHCPAVCSASLLPDARLTQVRVHLHAAR
jgi:hypothetical protein